MKDAKNILSCMRSAIFTVSIVFVGCSGFVTAGSFVAPSGGNLYISCVGGSAGAMSQFGTGTSQASFVPYLSRLPSSCPTAEVSIGTVTAGQTVPFGISTLWNNQTYWAFSAGTDQGSLVSFSDVCNSLGMGGSIIQQTSSTTWVLHLNDAAHYTISQCEANNILIQVRLAAATTTATAPALATPCSTGMVTGGYSYSVNGTLFSGETVTGYYSVVGVLTADGVGAVAGIDSISQNGAIQNGRTYSGTYSIQPNCTGTVSLNYSGQIVTFVVAVSASGDQISFLQTNAGAVGAGTATKQVAPADVLRSRP